jgi:hypothetical protein
MMATGGGGAWPGGTLAEPPAARKSAKGTVKAAAVMLTIFLAPAVYSHAQGKSPPAEQI